MGKGPEHGVILGQIRTLFDEGSTRYLSDGELVGRFLEDRGKSGEAAFGLLVHRHGPLVFGVCRRALGDPHQTEDAFQATFLVLARKARSIRNRDAVGPWLAGVAGKVAARARGDAARRRAVEGRAAGLAPRWSSEVATDRDNDEVDLLMREVDRLRRPLRDAVVLCHLQGLSYDSAAEALGVTEATVRGRLARARETLRARLVGRGIARDASPSALVPPLLIDAVPARLIGPIVRASMAVQAGRAVIGIVPRSAITLMEGALKAMTLAKWKATAALGLVVGVLAFGSTLSVQARQKPEAGKKDQEPKADSPEIALAVPGKLVRRSEVTKDCMVLAYMPAWNHGNVDNLGIGNNGGGVRTLVAWPDVPAAEASSPDLKFYLAFYARQTMSNPKPGSILAFEITDDWAERTAWTNIPSYEAEPILTAKFEPGEGWKSFDITSFVKEHQGKSGKGLLFRFLNEDRRGGDDAFSDYKLVSRESTTRRLRPQLLVVDPTKK